jgi:hypothetical protein
MTAAVELAHLNAHALVAEVLAAVIADGALYGELARLRRVGAQRLLAAGADPDWSTVLDGRLSDGLDLLALRVGERLVEGPRP